MDALRNLNHLSSVLTVEEWQVFKTTEDYLWMMAHAQQFKGQEMDELVKRGAKRREEAWTIALEMADSIISEEVKEVSMDVTEEQRRHLATSLAEKLLVEQNLTPPTFTAWCDCETCGRVPCPKDTPALTPNCPWCMV